MSRRRYDGYHGRTTARDALRFILCLLVIVLVLVAAGLMLGQRYLVYTDDGVRLELPFFQREQTQPTDQSLPVDVVQLPERPKPKPAVQPEANGTANVTGEEPGNQTTPE